MKTLSLLVVVVGVLLGSSSRADTLRCGSKLADQGMLVPEVVAKCGEPESKQTRFETLSETVAPATKSTPAVTRTLTRTIEEWVYNFGPNEFMRLVTFVDGRLTSVTSLSYGH